MRPSWRRVAEYGDNKAFAPDEVSRAIVQALADDCRRELPSEFVEALGVLIRDSDSLLFNEPLAPKLDALGQASGCGIDRSILGYASEMIADGSSNTEVLVEATEAALKDRASRGARQVEEHYLRKSSTPRAKDVRLRIEDAIRGPHIQALARQILKIDPRPSNHEHVRQDGLEDGVRL